MAAPFEVKLPPGYQALHYDVLPSTQDEVKKLAFGGASAGLWVVADKQSGGKGRQGRGWITLEGNLFASLLLYPACDVARLPELSFVAAVAVAAAFREFTEAKITCKWPNDVLIEGKKAAGILLEAENSGNPQKPWVIIGIGMNLKASPDKADFPATHLGDHTGKAPTRDLLFEVLAEKMAEALTRWARDGFGPIKTLWLNQAEGKGKTLKIETGGKVIEGQMMGLSKNGALLLEDFQGNISEILSGTVLKEGR